MNDPHNLNLANRSRYDSRREGMGAGTVVGMILGVLLILGGAMWFFSAKDTTTAITSPPASTTGQGNPSISPPPATTGQGGAMKNTPPATPRPMAPSATPIPPSGETTQGVDIEESPTMKQ